MKKKEVSERAVMARINRKIAAEGKSLRTHSPHSHAAANGRFYIVTKAGIVWQGDDLERLAVDLEVLESWEKLAV